MLIHPRAFKPVFCRPISSKYVTFPQLDFLPFSELLDWSVAERSLTSKTRVTSVMSIVFSVDEEPPWFQLPMHFDVLDNAPLCGQQLASSQRTSFVINSRHLRTFQSRKVESFNCFVISTFELQSHSVDTYKQMMRGSTNGSFLFISVRIPLCSASAAE